MPIRVIFCDALYDARAEQPGNAMALAMKTITTALNPSSDQAGEAAELWERRSLLGQASLHLGSFPS